MRDPSYPLPKAKPWYKRSQMKGLFIALVTLLLILAEEIWPSLPWNKIAMASLGLAGQVGALIWDQAKSPSVGLKDAEAGYRDAARAAVSAATTVRVADEA